MEKREIELILNDPKRFKELAHKAFKLADKNKNNVIERNELKDCLVEFAKLTGGPLPTDNDCEVAYKQLDKNKDGVINEEEFQFLTRQIMNTLLKLNKKAK